MNIQQRDAVGDTLAGRVRKRFSKWAIIGKIAVEKSDVAESGIYAILMRKSSKIILLPVWCNMTPPCEI